MASEMLEIYVMQGVKRTLASKKAERQNERDLLGQGIMVCS
jgi:hypothetical protein